MPGFGFHCEIISRNRRKHLTHTQKKVVAGETEKAALQLAHTEPLQRGTINIKQGECCGRGLLPTRRKTY